MIVKLADFTIKGLTISPTYIYQKQTLQIISKTEAIWGKHELIARNSDRELWNGTVYRLLHCNVIGKDVRLDIALTDYKAYLAAPYIRKELMKIPFSMRTNGMYVAALIITKDSKYLLGKTSANSLFPHKYDFISGSLNHDENVISKTSDIVDSMMDEIIEETGLSKADIRSIEGNCILVTSSTRIGIFFRVCLNKTSTQLRPILKPNFEHSQLICMTRNELDELIAIKSSVNPTVEFVINN